MVTKEHSALSAICCHDSDGDGDGDDDGYHYYYWPQDHKMEMNHPRIMEAIGDGMPLLSH